MTLIRFMSPSITKRSRKCHLRQNSTSSSIARTSLGRPPILTLSLKVGMDARSTWAHGLRLFFFLSHSIKSIHNNMVLLKIWKEQIFLHSAHVFATLSMFKQGESQGLNIYSGIAQEKSHDMEVYTKGSVYTVVTAQRRVKHYQSQSQ